MRSIIKDQNLTPQQQRITKLLFKFRFVSAGLLADVMGIRKVSAYKVLETLVSKGLVTKVYKPTFRIDRKPAYYYLNHKGVSVVRKLMDVKECVVNPLYKNDELTNEFIAYSLTLMYCYTLIVKNIPDDSAIFSKTEINRFKQFPKNRPDLYIRTPGNKEAIIVIVDDKPLYIVRKRLEEIITHSESGAWNGEYPRICFVLKDDNAAKSFLYSTRMKLESMGFDDEEICVLVISLKRMQQEASVTWSNAMDAEQNGSLF